MFRYFWVLSLLTVLSMIDQSDGCVSLKFPPVNGEIRPIPFLVHVWISRVDSGEHSCVGVVTIKDIIYVPEWCVTINGEKRGRIAIYSTKPKVESFSRACPLHRYEEQFNLVHEDDDLRELVMDRQSRFPNTVYLKIPKSLAYLQSTCLRPNGIDLYSRREDVISAVVSWRRGPNGEFFLVQKVIGSPYEKSFEKLREGFEDVAEAVISVSHSNDHAGYFEGFFKEPPTKIEFKRT